MSYSSGCLAKAWLKQYFDDANFPEWTKSQPGITAILSFPESKDQTGFFDQVRDIVCLLCEETFCHPDEEQVFLQHLLIEHRFVIGDVHLVSDLPSYVAYWRNKFVYAPVMTDYCHVVKMKAEDHDDVEKDYFFLSDMLLEDKELRIHLQMKKLEHVLDVHEKERKNKNFSRSCFFCRTTFEGCHADLLNHMAFDHNFSVGQPDNLVYVDELLDVLEKRLDDLVCIYCEKVFKSREVLKEHMRKKNHKKINPKNANYDKYYLVNYLEFGKSWEDIGRDERPFEDEDLPSGFDSDDSDAAVETDWSDWRGDLSGAVCLFCPASYTDVDDLVSHMLVIHDFDYDSAKAGLDFYQQIKLINFVRRQMHLSRCVFCGDRFEDRDGLLSHMKENGHMRPPTDREEWDQSQYYFPTYENDALLYSIDDGVDDGGIDNARRPPIIAQEVGVKESILFRDDFRRTLVPKNPTTKKKQSLAK